MKAKRNDFRAKAWKRHLLLQNLLPTLCLLLAAYAVFSLLISAFTADIQIPDDTRVLKALARAAVLKFPTSVEMLLDGSAISGVLMTIGLLTVIGPLLAITEQRVLGERIGRLVQWAYPLFFAFYFCVFIFTTLLGVYAASVGEDENKTAIALTSAAVLMGTGFILWVCCIFLIPGERRERLALTYYAHKMILVKKKATQKSAKVHLWRTRQLMLKLAGALARRETEGRELWADSIWGLWVHCAKQCEDAWKILDADGFRAAATDHCCLLAKKFWELLSKQAEMPLAQLELLPALLFTSNSSQMPAGEEENLEWDENARKAENYLTAGLLFTEDFQQAGADQAWQVPYQILCDLYCGKREWTDRGRTTFRKLFWGLAWVAMLHSAYETPADFRLLRELYYRGGMGQMLSEEEEEIRSFLKMFRAFYQRETRFQDGINVTDAGPVDYATRISDFLQLYHDNSWENVPIDPRDDLNAVRVVLLKEDM